MPITYDRNQRTFRITIPFLRPHLENRVCGTALRQRGSKATICLDNNDVYEALAATTELWSFSTFGMTRAEFIQEMSRLDAAAGSAIEGQHIALNDDALIEYGQCAITVELPAIEFYKVAYVVAKRNGGFGTKAYCEQINFTSGGALRRRETLARDIHEGLARAVTAATAAQVQMVAHDNDAPTDVLPDFDDPSSPRVVD